KLGPDHVETLSAMAALADAYRVSGRLGEASSLLRETVSREKAAMGPDNPSTLDSMAALARTELDAGRLEESLCLFEETLSRRRAALGRDHPDTLRTQGDLARAYVPTNPDRALSLARDLLAIREQKHPDDWLTFEARSLVGSSLLGLN